MTERWYRVFGGNETAPAPAALLENLHSLGFDVTGRIHGDGQGWFRAELELREGLTLTLERYLATADDIRAELNSWAAWVESVADGPDAVKLMQRLIAARQVFTLRRPPEDAAPTPVEEVCVSLCRFLAAVTAGAYQVDGQGFFSADGTQVIRDADE
jgi:hypothetical protein